jgi:hypothetical protein
MRSVITINAILLLRACFMVCCGTHAAWQHPCAAKPTLHGISGRQLKQRYSSTRHVQLMTQLGVQTVTCLSQNIMTRRERHGTLAQVLWCLGAEHARTGGAL